MRPIVIIDGNNLAHVKYNFKGDRVPLSVFNNMFNDLKTWAYNEGWSVELCLDPCAIQESQTDLLSVLVHYTKADDLVEERARIHSNLNDACMVITNDEDLQNIIRKIGLKVVSCFDFVSRRGSYIFMQLPPIREVTLKAPYDGNSFSRKETDKQNVNSKQDQDVNELEGIHLKTMAIRGNPVVKDSIINLQHNPQNDDQSIIQPDLQPVSQINPQPDTGKRYYLNLSNWPLERGIKFILDSTCKKHRNELNMLIGDIHKASRDDMTTLFGMFVDLCKNEPDLIDRGGSLMDKIRLSLVKSYPDNLDEKQIMELTKRVAGSTGKLRKNVPFWFDVVNK